VEEYMKIKIVKVGNSRGLRIPKPLIDQTGLRDEVEVEVVDKKLIIRPVSKPRSGWEQAFKAMADAGDDKLVNGNDIQLTGWEKDEWKWR